MQISSRRHPRGRGFTLVEILVSVGVIALLLGILVPAVASVRRSAKKLEEISAASQLMMAYTMYADDNDGRLLRGIGGTAFDANGNEIDDSDFIEPPEVYGPASRYPWRKRVAEPLPPTLPVESIRSGVIAGSGLYGSLMFFMLTVHAGVRRTLRRRRSLCTACAYPVTEGTCPECGREVESAP